MIPSDIFRDQPVLTGELVRLEQLADDVLDEYLAMLAEPELTRLTGSHGGIDVDVDRERIQHWLAGRPEQTDRADWAAFRIDDGAFLGEVVLNQLDPANESCNFRIALAEAYLGKGYGSEITQLVVDYALGAGLHRISLGVYEFNGRARRAYEKAGFVLEGRLRDALLWEGEWHDELVMAVLASDRRP